MKLNRYNHKVWTNNQTKLIKFFREQLQQLPPDWDMNDHILMIMNTLVVQLEASGVPRAEAKNLYDSAIHIAYEVNGPRKVTKH